MTIVRELSRFYNRRCHHVHIIKSVVILYSKHFLFKKENMEGRNKRDRDEKKREKKRKKPKKK